MDQHQFSVQVKATYLPDESDAENRQFAFAYTITITNTGAVPSQLISRHWVIEDSNGRMQKVDGLGVVGHQPLLRPGQSFEYSSGSQLETPSGRMHGTYFFVAEDGTRFEAPIPAFDLSMPRTLH